VGSIGELADRFGINYRAPVDARATGLESGSVDFVSSTVTLEHVPREHVIPLLGECVRLLRPDGVVSALIDLTDHYSQIDESISRYNFLRYSDRAWRRINSNLQHQNRMRRPDYLAAFAEAGLEIVWEKSMAGGEAHIASLRKLDLAERFRAYPFDELAVARMRVVARPKGAPHQTAS